MYADDTVLLSEDVDDLQKMINSVNICSNEYGLYINLLKTKIGSISIALTYKEYNKGDKDLLAINLYYL
jgi:hypothetical protein